MNNGFFSRKELTQMETSAKHPDCLHCNLDKDCLSPKMDVHGEGKDGILIVGEAPGTTEDKKGEQFVGDTGIFLRKTLRKIGYDLEKDFWKTNAINCFPGKDSKGDFLKPTDSQIQCCRPLVMQQIKQLKPKVVILLGKSALLSVVGAQYKKDIGGISRWRGFVIPDQNFKTKICPTFHPSYVSREEDTNPSIFHIWKEDLRRALKEAEKPFIHKPIETYQSQIQTLTDEQEIVEYIYALRKYAHRAKEPYSCAIDYETSGLKPHAKGHYIYSCSIASSQTQVVVFPVMSKDVKDALVSLWKDGHVGKIAANIKFEKTWTKVILRSEVENWNWDTMLAAHVLDNRERICALKFQTYVHFGIPDYDSHIAPFLVSPDGSNGFNSIQELPSEDVFYYNALDSIFEINLAKKQMRELGYDHGTIREHVNF